MSPLNRIASVVLAATALSAAERVDLTIDMGAVTPAAMHPVRSGIPIAQGKVKHGEQVRLLRAGSEAELQTRVLATWPDGSVKWVLLDFLGRSGETVTVEYGNEVKRTPPAKAIAVRSDDVGVMVDNGTVRFAVRKDGTAFLDSVDLDIDGNGNYEAGERVVQPAAAGERRHVLDFVHRPAAAIYGPRGNALADGIPGPSTMRISEVEVEEAGPLHAVVRVRGTYHVARLGEAIAKDLRRPHLGDFSIWLHLYRDSAVIEGDTHFVYEGVGDDDFIKAWGLRLRTQPGMRLTTTIDGKAVTAEADAQAPLVALTQTGANASQVWRADAARQAQSILARGGRSPGWVDLSGEKWGVSLGVRWFWKRHPTAIHYDAATGEASLMLHPPEVPLMDLRRYARDEWGTGEGGAASVDLDAIAPTMSKGVASSKEFRLEFHRGAADAGALAQNFQAFESRPLAMADPEHYAASRALGDYLPRKAGVHADYEQKIDEHLERFRRAQDEAGWYGQWDYGDLVQRFGEPGKDNAHQHGRWENDWGRWGWANGDGFGRVDRAYLFAWLRTGNRAWFEMGEANVRHRNDSDIRQSPELPFDCSVQRKIPKERTTGPYFDLRGTASRHGVQHWSCGYLGARGGNPVGQRLYFLLTGHAQTADILDISRELGLSKFGWAGRPAIPQRWGMSGGGDGLGSGLQGILSAWERSGDPVYGQVIKAALGQGGVDRDMLVPSGHWGIGMSSCFGLFPAMAEYASLSGDPNATALVAEVVARTRKLDHKNWQWPSDFLRIIAEAPGADPAVAELASGMVKDAVAKGLGFEAVIDMPYLMAAIKRAGGVK